MSSAVGTTTLQRVGWSGFWILVGDKRCSFTKNSRLTQGAYSASYSLGAEILFWC